MLPIWAEFATFIRDQTGLDLEEGKFWYDNRIVKGFGDDGKLYKLYKLNVTDDLSMTYSSPRGYGIPEGGVQLLTWQQFINNNYDSVKAKVAESLDIIRKYIDLYPDKEPLVLTSTGKDSMCLLHMVNQIYPNVKSIFNNTTLDVAGTYRMAKSIPNCRLITPKEGFYQYVRRAHMIPTRFGRFCCKLFKERILPRNVPRLEPHIFFMGLRHDESNARSQVPVEYTNPEWGRTNWIGVNPMLEWTDLDVWMYILHNNIPINEKYKQGYTRVGCAVACPFYTKTTWILDKYWYPHLYNRWQQILSNAFIQDGISCTLNCTLKEFTSKYWNGGVVRSEPTEEVISEFMEHRGITDEDIAKEYFNKTCSNCGKKIKKDETALSLKIYGTNTRRFLCRQCFMKENNINKEELNQMIDGFKSDGCKLF